MAHHRQLDIICDSLKTSRPPSDVLMSEVSDLKTYVVAESVRNQVLCEYTAFVCIGKVNADVREHDAIK